MSGAASRSPAAGVESKIWPDDTVVYRAAGARFGDDIWDLSALKTTVNHSPRLSHVINFTVGLPGGWSLLARELCMCRIDVRTARKAGIILQRPVKPQTTHGRMVDLRRVAAFQVSTGRGMPASWTQADADALIRWRAEQTGNHRNLTKAVELVWDLRLFAPLLTEGGLAFDPWPGLTYEQVLTKVLGDDKPALPAGTLTPLLPLEAFVPLFVAARAYVEVFAPDILALHRLLRSSPLEPRAEPTVEALHRWAEDPGTRIPIHTEASASLPCMTRWGTRPGDPIWAIIARVTGGSRPRTVRRRCQDVIQKAIDEGRVYEGLGPITAMVERPDGTTGPWRGPFETLVDVNAERAMLRTAAYILLAGLTGMRDSEAQDLRRDAAHESYGTPALRTRRHKMRVAEPEPISWWVCDLALVAYRVLDALSDHPTHVMATVTGRRRAGFDARFAMHDFAAHINATVATAGLAPIPPVEQLSPQVLRETAAYALGRFTELGDLVIGYLFGHARSTMTASYQRYRPGDSWNARMQEGDIDATAVLLDTMGRLINQGEPVIGGYAGELQEAAIEVRATIVADPTQARRIAELHKTTWHHGEVVSCRFDPRAAVCHRLARQMGVSTPEPGPLVDLCVGTGCANAHYTPLQLPALHQRRNDIRQRLAVAAAGSPAARQLTADLTDIDNLINRLEAKR